MEKETKHGGGKTEHGHPITPESHEHHEHHEHGKTEKKHEAGILPTAKDDGPPGTKTEHASKGPITLSED
jgi:hypothetical protein